MVKGQPGNSHAAPIHATEVRNASLPHIVSLGRRLCEDWAPAAQQEQRRPISNLVRVDDKQRCIRSSIQSAFVSPKYTLSNMERVKWLAFSEAEAVEHL